MHFRHTSAKIQPKNLKQHFDWEDGGPPSYDLEDTEIDFLWR